jgi:hypothetical protein
MSPEDYTYKRELFRKEVQSLLEHEEKIICYNIDVLPVNEKLVYKIPQNVEEKISKKTIDKIEEIAKRLLS